MSDWDIRKTEEAVTKRGDVYYYIGFHGGMKITIEVPVRHRQHVKWTDHHHVHAKSGTILIDYRDQTVEFTLGENQIFSLRNGNEVFQITTNKKEEGFLYLDDAGTFIPDLARLKRVVTVQKQLA
jgi:hypothetical protein